MTNRSRGSRLSKHWVHTSLNPLANPAATGVFVAQDTIVQYAAAIGVQSGPMTAMRVIGDVGVNPSGVVGTVLVAFALLVTVKVIVAGTIANPLGTSNQDFTDYMYWTTFGVSNGDPSDKVLHRHVDVRGMRKFDPTRESLFAIWSVSAGASANDFDVWHGLRVLCGD